jgi:antitoxin component of MazEF toxin-antitoxin module
MPVEFEIKVVKVGNSLRVTIPKELCKATRIEQGATVIMFLTDGDITLRKAR